MTHRAPSGDQWLAQAGALGLSRRGNELSGPCPHCGGTDRFHVHVRGPRSGVFSCRQCHARGDSTAASRILEAAGFARAGGGGEDRSVPRPPTRPVRTQQQSRSGRRQVQLASLWNRLQFVSGTPAEACLARRRVWDPAHTALPDCVRWLPFGAAAEAGLRWRPDREIPHPDTLGFICYRFDAADGRIGAVQCDALAPEGMPWPSRPPGAPLSGPYRWRQTRGELADAAMIVPGDGSPIAVAEGPVDVLALG